ncbi:hypothetical protein [Kitasatospora griseola]|uniref:hypothetical protein n=1 Tax=Kitasatospora griseola TaxID=2064 RepID=UPI00365A13B5
MTDPIGWTLCAFLPLLLASVVALTLSGVTDEPTGAPQEPFRVDVAGNRLPSWATYDRPVDVDARRRQAMFDAHSRTVAERLAREQHRAVLRAQVENLSRHRAELFATAYELPDLAGFEHDLRRTS